VTPTAHLRGIVIAGALAALALALGFVTLAMNQTASKAAPPHRILPLKLRHHTVAKHAATKPHVHKRAKRRVNAHFTAALAAGLPRSVAHALAAHGVAVVEINSKADPVATLAAGEARSGARLANASYVSVNVDRDGGDVEVLTRLLGRLPVAPTTLVYMRPATLATTLTGCNDRTVVQQAAASAVGAAVAASAR
jgi:hypothetical protein